jgi:hypothetical protein
VAKVAQNVRRLAAALARGERWARELGRGDLFDGAAVAAERLHGYVRGSAENRLFVFAALDVLEERFPKGVPTDAEMRIGATR